MSAIGASVRNFEDRKQTWRFSRFSASARG
jgi:hypothetical protein